MTESSTVCQYEVLGPWPEVDPKPLNGLTAPRLTDLSGKRIGFLCNTKRAARPISEAVEKALKERFPGAEVSRYTTINAVGPAEIETEGKPRFEEWLKGLDAVIATVGDWGACTKYLVYEAISVEERSRPAVALIYRDFAADARSASSTRGMPGLRVIPESIVSESTDGEEIQAGVTAVIADVVDALTRPLTKEERSPQPKEVEKPRRLIFRGALDEVNRFFYQRGWTDGLPIIPPTEAAVAEMMKGTDLPADRVVAKLEPRLGKATVEKIAINGVMAGALPTYMPLLVAGVQAMADPSIGVTGMAVSTGSFAPFWIVNGPIRKDVHLNGGYGALSPGDMANAAIGRAFALLVANMRGVRKGVEDMGVLGNPAKYSMAMAENDEDNPWRPLHVDRGLSMQDSAITLAFCDSFTQLMPAGTDDKGILSSLVHNVPAEVGGSLVIMLPPTLARALSNRGWTKKDIKDFLTARQSPRQTDVQIVVAGGSGSRIGVFRGSPRPGVTKKVELPSGWAKLVAKYKNVITSHEIY